MEPTEKSGSYPVFEPNQVLSDWHLNQAFDYLDEQERLTRANLIGIGIVCGLEIKLDGNSIILSKGCGITSEGYLIVEPGATLKSYRTYTLPPDLDYPLFKDNSEANKPQYLLWELFPEGEPNTTPLGTPQDFLKDKAVLLFLEPKKEGLRNCSPNNCDNKGSEVTATVRRLLLNRTDLEKIIAEANGLKSGLTSEELEKVSLARLSLPVLRLPRYDVPNKKPITTQQVLAAFLSVFSSGIVKNTGSALNSAYAAFEPLLEEEYPKGLKDILDKFNEKFGFLDSAPEKPAQVRFLQYYYDFFDDLIKAYDEFRLKGIKLLCVCCPPEKLFPRHLMLGVLTPEVRNPIYRQKFLASPAVSRCEEEVKELRQLFKRMIEMIKCFTDEPLEVSKTSVDEQIRITPSKLGDVSLSDKAIPYYYIQDGEPPLYKLWNDGINLSYRSDEYEASTPDFVKNPLCYDIEPYNFLRIEGHLGKNYQTVLQSLLTLKEKYRLPIEIIALQTGGLDENITVDLSKERCRFQDLEALYDSLREEILSSLCEGVMYLYDTQIRVPNLAGGDPKLSLIKKYAPNYRYKNGTLGAWCEKYLARFEAKPYIDVDQNKIDSNEVLKVYCPLFTGTTGLAEEYWAHAVSVYYFIKLAHVLPFSLDTLAYADFENKYQDLIGLIRFFRSDAVSTISDEFKKFIPQKDLIDHFDQVLFSCKLIPIKAIHEEYVRRIREVKQKQFLSYFLQKNPGIQHKAGVPVGGTFIIVYHQNPTQFSPISSKISAGTMVFSQPGRMAADLADMTTFVSDEQSQSVINAASKDRIGTRIAVNDVASSNILGDKLTEAINRIASSDTLGRDPDIRTVIDSLRERIPGIIVKPVLPGVISKAVSELKDGEVIADFFLPYLCCSDCPPVQFVLPKTPPTFTVQIGCTNSDNMAEVTIVPKDGEPPFNYQLDGQPSKELTGTLLLSTGSHILKITDSAGSESTPQTFTVPGPLTIGTESYIDNVTARAYQVKFDISGGTAPYKAESGTITGGNTFTSGPVNSGEEIKLAITDSVGCNVEKSFMHIVEEPCKLPCNGIAIRRGYRFSLPEPDESLIIKVGRFSFEDPKGNRVDLKKDVAKIIRTARGNDFAEQVNGLISKKVENQDWLIFKYQNIESQFGLDTWEIEYFECLKFEMQITWSSRVITHVPPATNLLVNQDGSNIKVNQQNQVILAIPAFNIAKIEKCKPERPITKLCQEINLKLEISKKIEGEKVRLRAVPSGDDAPIAYLWEIQDGNPALSNKQEDVFTLSGQGDKIIRLSAYTKTGCRVVEAGTVKIG